LGTIISLYVADGWVGERLLYVTAGGFIYLAAVTILPEVLEDDQHSLLFRLAQLAAFVSGIGFLYLVYLLEEYDEKDGTVANNHGHGHGHSHHHQDEHNQGHNEL
jgi:hypothetical protein